MRVIVLFSVILLLSTVSAQEAASTCSARTMRTSGDACL